MSEFLDQFQIEVRELAEQATDDLLILEQAPADRDCLERVFRAFHTLKGAAGIVDFAAMRRAMHAAEDVLASLRDGREAVSAALIGNCLACLTQVTDWLAAIPEAGIPPEGADAAADRMIARLLGPGDPPPTAPGNDSDWIERLRAEHPAAGRASLAVRYVPAANCFFQDEDPLALLGGLPGLCALDIGPLTPWAPLDDFDPFSCNLVFRALADATPQQGAVHFYGARGEVSLHPLAAPATAAALPDRAASMLQAQVALLRRPVDERFAGRLTSAGRVAGNVLRHLGMLPEAQAMDVALADASASGDATPLLAALEQLMQPRASAPDQPEARREQPAVAQPAGPGALRVDFERVDAIVRLMGELTVAKNAIGHVGLLARTGHDLAEVAEQLNQQYGLLDRLTTQLHDAVLAIRVLPMRDAFRRFPPVVRELAARLDKAVRVDISGEATEADKTVVETLFEPLLHVLRNTIDHGIETAAGRMAAGKPATAVIGLHSRRDGKNVVIEISDDGAGIDIAAIRKRAEAHGLLSATALAALSDEAVANLIFTPGLSTAAVVTDLSGRGVGMDAVRTAIERLGGRVSVQSRLGEGTTIRFTVPFSVVMTRVVTLETAGQVFGVPLDAVTETLQVPREGIFGIGAAEAFVLRGRTVPIVNLVDALDLALVTVTKRHAAPTTPATLVVTTLDGEAVAFEVDSLHGQLNVMLKPVSGLLAGVRGVAGTTLLGNGRVLIVLDLLELLR